MVDYKKTRNVLSGNIVIDYSPKVLQIIGLGSCVAVAFYSSEKKLGAMAHIVLPSSYKAKTPELKGKYADTAINRLLDLFKEKKVKTRDITVKITGGANMFAGLRTKVFDIGNKNIQAVKEELQKHNLRIKGENLRGNRGRSVFFHLTDGRIEITLTGGKNMSII